MTFEFKNVPREKIVRNDPFELITGDILYHVLTPKVGDDKTKPPMLGAVATYQIIGELSHEDSFGYSYAAYKLNPDDVLDYSSPLFIKTPRVQKDLHRRDILAGLAEIEASFRAEYDNRSRIAGLNEKLKVAANIEGLGYYMVEGKNDRQYNVPFLAQEYINQYTLEEFFTSPEYKSQSRTKGFLNGGKFIGITDSSLWFKLAESIIDIVRRVHNRQIVHGELVPKNILLKKEGDDINPILVDFGQSFQLDVSSVEASRAKRTSYLAPECRAPHLRFYTPADIYSLGGVLYYLATGTPPPDIDDEDLKIFPTKTSWATASQRQTDLWKTLIHAGFDRNPGLKVHNEGIVKIIDKCLRPRPADRYSSADKVLQALNAVNYQARKTVSVKELSQKVIGEWSNVEKRDSDKDNRWTDLFNNIVGDKLEILIKEMADMNNGHYEIYGEREDIIDTLIKYIGVLQPGDTYVTVTMPGYWTEDNLGVNGRFLTVNKDLARNGVFVNRLFLITEDDLVSESSRRILRAHLNAWNSLDDKNRATKPTFPIHPNNDEVDEGKMYVGVREVPSKDDIRLIQQDVEHVAIWSNAKTGHKMSIIFVLRPIYDEVEGDLIEASSQIVKVRFRALVGRYEYDQLVEMFDDKAKPLFQLNGKLGEDQHEMDL